MHSHHNHCEHALKFCEKCDRPYCTKCLREWYSYSYSYSYGYQLPYQWTTAGQIKLQNADPIQAYSQSTHTHA